MNEESCIGQWPNVFDANAPLNSLDTHIHQPPLSFQFLTFDSITTITALNPKLFVFVYFVKPIEHFWDNSWNWFASIT